MIVLDSIQHRFGTRAALAGVSLRIPRGSCLALVGPSGCGKSTLLRVINGLVRPDSGTVTIDGQPLTDGNLGPLRLRMGYVIQDGGLFPHLTGRDNVALVARHLRWSADRIGARLTDLCSLTRLPLDLLPRYPAEISGGQRQRLSLMRALFLDPDLLLLDEPLGALDPLVRADLQDDLRDIFRTLGKTVVFVTHDLAEAAHLGDDIALLRDGRMVQRGSLDELRQSPADPFVSRFIQAQRFA